MKIWTFCSFLRGVSVLGTLPLSKLNKHLNLITRSLEVPHPDWSNQGLDARHFLQEWERSSKARDHCAKRLRQDLSQWRDSIQYSVSVDYSVHIIRGTFNNAHYPLQNILDFGVSDGPEAVSTRQANLRSSDSKLWVFFCSLIDPVRDGQGLGLQFGLPFKHYGGQEKATFEDSGVITFEIFSSLIDWVRVDLRIVGVIFEGFFLWLIESELGKGQVECLGVFFFKNSTIRGPEQCTVPPSSPSVPISGLNDWLINGNKNGPIHPSIHPSSQRVTFVFIIDFVENKSFILLFIKVLHANSKRNKKSSLF